MKPIEFPEQNTVYAKDQPEYIPLPAHKTEEGQVISCLEMSMDEIAEITRTGKIWVSVLTFNYPLQPMLICAFKNELFEEDDTQKTDNP